MARLIVQYPDICPVLIDGQAKGTTNEAIRVGPGVYRVAPDDECEPRDRELRVAPGADPEEIVYMTFVVRARKVDRLDSSLYCRYNGFMLGQFMVASFASYARGDFPQRQSRMQEFLNEIGAGIAVPDWRPMDSEDSIEFMRKVLAVIEPISHELAGFTILSSALMQWSIWSDEDEAGNMMEETIGIVVQEYELPEPDFSRFVPRKDAQGRISANSLLDPALAYLRQILETNETGDEDQTAFVVMPFSAPFDTYYALYYRPALEEAGFRAMRAWGGLSSEHYAPLLQQLIKSCGLVLADVSKERLGSQRRQRNLNVLYEIGVAHAFGTGVIIVVDETDLEGLPANIGDAASAYSPQSAKWPEDAIESTSGFIHMHRAAPTAMPRAIDLEAAIDESRKRLERIIIPQEARDAYVRAVELYQQGDHEKAERQFSDAIDLGNNATEVHFFRAMNRFKLSRFTEAEQDLDTVVARDDFEEVDKRLALHEEDETESQPGIHATALFYRGYAKQMQGKEAQAQEDYAAAQGLGFLINEDNSEADNTA
jgi:tetratricopeptide (TPR) repeat protein